MPQDFIITLFKFINILFTVTQLVSSQIYNDEYRYKPFRYIFTGDQGWSLISSNTFCFKAYQYGFNHNLTAFHLRDYQKGCSTKDEYYGQLLPPTNTIKARWHGITHYDKVLYYLTQPGQAISSIKEKNVYMSFSELGFTKESITYESDKGDLFSSLQAFYFLLGWTSIHNSGGYSTNNGILSLRPYEKNQHLLRGVIVIHKSFEEAYYIIDSFGKGCKTSWTDLFMSEVTYFSQSLKFCWKKMSLTLPENWDKCFNPGSVDATRDTLEQLDNCLLESTPNNVVNPVDFNLTYPHHKNCTIYLIFENNGHEEVRFNELSTLEIFDLLIKCIKKYSYYQYMLVQKCKTWISVYTTAAKLDNLIRKQTPTIQRGQCVFYTQTQYDFTLPLATSKLNLKELATEYLRRSIIKPHLYTCYIVSIIFVLPAVIALMIVDFVRRARKVEKTKKIKKLMRKRRKYSTRKEKSSVVMDDEITESSSTYKSNAKKKSEIGESFAPRAKSAPPGYTQKTSSSESFSRKSNKSVQGEHFRPTTSYNPRPGSVAMPSQNDQRHQVSAHISDDEDDSDEETHLKKRSNSQFYHRATDYQLRSDDSRYKLKKETVVQDEKGNVKTTYSYISPSSKDDEIRPSFVRERKSIQNSYENPSDTVHGQSKLAESKNTLSPPEDMSKKSSSKLSGRGSTASVHKSRQTKKS